MKSRYLVIVLAVLCYVNALMGLELSISNVQTITGQSGDYLSFDVMASSEEPAQCLGTGIVLIDYNSGAFGESVKVSNNVLVTKGVLTSSTGVPLYNIIVNDNQVNRLAVTYEYISEPGCGNLLTAAPATLVHIQMIIVNYSCFSSLSFGLDLMNSQQYLDDNTNTFSNVHVVGLVDEYLAPAPVNVSIAVNSGIVTVSWQGDPNCVYNVYTNNFPENDNWQLEAEGVNQASWSSPSAAGKFFRVTSDLREGFRKKGGSE